MPNSSKTKKWLRLPVVSAGSEYMAELADAVDLKTVVSLPNELLPLVYVRTLATENDHSDAHTVNMVSTISLLMRSNGESFCACRWAASY